MSVDLAAILPLPEAVVDNAFAPMAGETPLERVSRTMLGAAVVVAAEPVFDRVRKALADQGLSTLSVIAAKSPGSRAQCLAAGLRHVDDKARHVLIHDIRRPLAPVGLRDTVIAALHAGSPIVMPALAVTDSVKVVDKRGSVIGTLDRSTLQSVQYPRGFAVDRLAQLLAGRAAEDFDELDEALRVGAPITFVEGDSDAFIVELPRDTAYVEAVIAER
jgi:2-C-methyl-D-erythritol 4-phosphate cytidylyltransferase